MVSFEDDKRQVYPSYKGLKGHLSKFLSIVEEEHSITHSDHYSIFALHSPFKFKNSAASLSDQYL